jgi:hypothetical protein
LHADRFVFAPSDFAFAEVLSGGGEIQIKLIWRMTAPDD